MEIILIFSTSVRTSMPDTKPERVQITIKPELIDLMGLGDPFPGIPSHLSQFTALFPHFLAPFISFLRMHRPQIWRAC